MIVCVCRHNAGPTECGVIYDQSAWLGPVPAGAVQVNCSYIICVSMIALTTIYAPGLSSFSFSELFHLFLSKNK